MTIWKKSKSVDEINKVMTQDTLMEALGIQITEVTENSLAGSMPVDKRTHQPFGFLHGGASVALAETLGSMASWLTIGEDKICFGMDIQANHIRPVTEGIVTGSATPIHLGSTTQIWDINIKNEENKLVCVARINMAVKKL